MAGPRSGSPADPGDEVGEAEPTAGTVLGTNLRFHPGETNPLPLLISVLLLLLAHESCCFPFLPLS